MKRQISISIFLAIVVILLALLYIKFSNDTQLNDNGVLTEETYNKAGELESSEESGYTKIVAGNLNISETVRYVRVTFPEGSKDKVILKSVEISSGVRSIPLTEAAPANTFEDGEYYFGDNSNVEAAYTISAEGNKVKYAKALGGADYTAYDCVFAWIESDGSGNKVTLQLTDKNNCVWASAPFVLENSESTMHKFNFADFTCSDADAVMDLSQVLSFDFIVTGGSDSASVALDVSERVLTIED